METKLIATSASRASSRIRARTRVTGPSSTTESTPEKMGTAAENPTTAQAHASYEGGKSVRATAIAPATTSAARSRTSQRPGRLSTAFLQPLQRPRRDFARRLVRVVEVGGHGVPFAVATHVACRDQRVQSETAAVVSRDVEPREAAPQLVRVAAEPVEERDVRRRILRQRLARAPLLDAAIPWADVLADVTAVDLGLELRAVLVRRRLGRLRPVGEAARRVERSRLVERARGAGVDAEPALPAVEAERRGRLELDVCDERPEHDPGAVPARDQECVLAVEADAAARRRLAVDVLVRVDEDPVRAAQPPAEHVELLPQLRVGVEPRVARQPAVPCRTFRLGQPVAERGRDDGASAGQQS